MAVYQTPTEAQVQEALRRIPTLQLRRAFFEGAVAKQTNCNTAVLLRLGRVCSAGGKRNNAGDNA